MPKNVLFTLKNCKNHQTLGALPADPLASGRRLGAPPPGSHISHPAFLILLLRLPTLTDTFESIKRPYVLVIIVGVHQAFGVEKLCCISYATDFGNYNHGFFYFSFCPPPTHFALAPPLATVIAFCLTHLSPVLHCMHC